MDQHENAIYCDIVTVFSFFYFTNCALSDYFKKPHKTANMKLVSSGASGSEAWSAFINT